MASEDSLFNFGNAEICCVICGKKNLNYDPVCLNSKTHKVDEKILSEETERIFDGFVDSLVINSKEKKNIGTVSDKHLIPDDSTYEEVSKIMNKEMNFRNIIEDSFPESILADLKHKNDLEKKTKGKSKNQATEKFFHDQDLFFCLSSSSNIDAVKKSQGYKKFLVEKFYKTMDEILKDPNYVEFVKFFLGENPTMEMIQASFEQILEFQFLSGICNCFTFDIISETVRFQMILTSLRDDKRRQFFIERIKKLRNSESTKFSDHVNFMKHLISVNLLKNANSDCYMPEFTRTFESKYMSDILSTQTKAYNFSYGFNIIDFTMIYKGKIKKNDFYNLSKREEIFQTNEHKDHKEILDFLNYFNKIKVGNGISQVVYKKGHDEIYVSQKSTMKIDLSYGDFFGIYFDDGSSVIIDILTEEALFKGNGKSIKNNVEILKKINIEFDELEFVHFEGKMTVVTTGVLLKRILSLFINRIEEIKKYWFTKSQSTSTNNHSFVYWPEDIKTIPAVFKESVDFNIIFQSKINIILNKWEVNFAGNQNSFIIPFFSMFLSLVHLMENLKHAPKYAPVQSAIDSYLSYYKRKNEEGKKKASDTATLLVSKHEIVKREAYNRALKHLVGNTSEMENFNSRSKPIVFDISRFDNEEIVFRWKLFYSHIMHLTSPVFSTDRDKVLSMKIDEIIQYARKNVIFENNTFKINGFGCVGISYRDRMFLSYPEKGKMSQLEIKNQFPVKSSVINVTDKKVFIQKHQGLSSRKKNVTPSVQAEIGHYTDIIPSKSGFYFPKKRDFVSFRNFVENNYPNMGERHALLYQHMWDYTPEEIEKTFDEINIPLHQDLLQNYHGAAIIFLKYDSSKKIFEYKEPRNRFGYYRNSTYDKVMFIFEMAHDRMDVIYFDEGNDYIQITDKIRNFMKFEKNVPHPVTAPQLINMLDSDERISGQFFDTNGKSIGVRITKRGAVMDLRYSAQFPVFEKTIDHNFGRLSTTETNVNEKFGAFKDDDRFSLVPKKSKSVKYRISEIHEETRNWRKDVYFFTRTLITYWMISNPHGKVYTTKDIDEFVEEMIVPGYRPMQSQMIDELIVLRIFPTIQQYSSYLETIYPSRFYEGKFHVEKSEIEKIKSYMKAEICPIKNCSIDFRRAYCSMRVQRSVLKKNSDEIIGIDNIFYNNMISVLKEKKLNEDRFLFSNVFYPAFDFKYADSQPKQKKAELVIIPFREKYYMIRMTEKGYFNIAVHVCDLWFKKKEIASYYTTEERKISAARKFRLELDEIIESRDNEEDKIRLTGEDYWVLSYSLKNGSIVYAAMLPIEII